MTSCLQSHLCSLSLFAQFAKLAAGTRIFIKSPYATIKSAERRKAGEEPSEIRMKGLGFAPLRCC